MDTTITDLTARPCDARVTSDTSPTIDLFAPPPVGPGAPTLARHMASLAGVVWDLVIAGASLKLEHYADYVAALDALAALPKVATGRQTLNGKEYIENEDGSLLPVAMVKDAVLLEDEFVRTVAAGAMAVNASLRRFRTLSFAEAQALLDTLHQTYQVERAGKRGNVTFHSIDRAYRVQVTSQERMTVGAGIEVARTLLSRWLEAVEASDEVKALINSAFGLDDQGRVRVAELVRLRRLNITHELWSKAMQAIDDAIETAGTQIYMRVYQRNATGAYELIALDLASA